MRRVGVLKTRTSAIFPRSNRMNKIYEFLDDLKCRKDISMLEKIQLYKLNIENFKKYDNCRTHSS